MAAVADRVELSPGGPLGQRLYGDLVWSRPSFFRRELKLEAGSERLAVLRWPRMVGFEAVAETGDGRWIIGRHRGGSLRGQFVVRDASTREVVATHTRDWRGAGLTRFASGSEFKWQREGFWRPTYFWSSVQRPRIIAFRLVMGWRRSYEMEVDPGAHGLPELPVLVVLGAYVMAAHAAERRAH